MRDQKNEATTHESSVQQTSLRGYLCGRGNDGKQTDTPIESRGEEGAPHPARAWPVGASPYGKNDGFAYDLSMAFDRFKQAAATRFPLLMERVKLAAELLGQTISRLDGGSEGPGIKPRWLRRLLWFSLANAAVTTTWLLLVGMDQLRLTVILVLYAMCSPFFYLVFSKWRAQQSHSLTPVRLGEPGDARLEHAFRTVEALSAKAGLTRMPEVYVYDSPEVNAFATGMSRNRSLVAFSSALVHRLDGEALSAVAAHEIAHVACGDMVTLTMVQSVVNAVVLIVCSPLYVLRFLYEREHAMHRVLRGLHYAVSQVLLFLGNLVANAFSRRREFEADRLAATLVERGWMVMALRQLAEDATDGEEQESFAMFKIKGRPSFLELFSTHPSVERRIQALLDAATPQGDLSQGASKG